MVKQAARNATKKKGAVKVKKKTVTKAKQKKEQDHHHASSSSSSSPSIRSKFVGVTWLKKAKKWLVQIKIDGKKKSLGYFHDEKEAACKYDEQAALLNKPVNFPQHEGQEQAVKRAPKGSGLKCKSRAKSSKDGDDREEQEQEEAMDEDSDDDDDSIILDGDQQTTASSSSSQSPTFLQHLVHQQATFLQVKQELTEDLVTAQQQQAAIDDAMADEDLCVVCMDRERSCLYVPCNHLAVCVECDAGIMAASQPCPMCNTEIDREGSLMGVVVA